MLLPENNRYSQHISGGDNQHCQLGHQLALNEAQLGLIL